MLSREWGGLNGVVWLTTYIISFWSSATDPKRLSCNRCQATSWKHEDCVRQDFILLHAHPPLPIKFKVTYLAVQHSAKNYHASPNRPTCTHVHVYDFATYEDPRDCDYLHNGCVPCEDGVSINHACFSLGAVDVPQTDGLKATATCITPASLQLLAYNCHSVSSSAKQTAA